MRSSSVTPTFAPLTLRPACLALNAMASASAVYHLVSASDFQDFFADENCETIEFTYHDGKDQVSGIAVKAADLGKQAKRYKKIPEEHNAAILDKIMTKTLFSESEGTPNPKLRALEDKKTTPKSKKSDDESAGDNGLDKGSSDSSSMKSEDESETSGSDSDSSDSDSSGVKKEVIKKITKDKKTRKAEVKKASKPRPLRRAGPPRPRRRNRRRTIQTATVQEVRQPRKIPRTKKTRRTEVRRAPN